MRDSTDHFEKEFKQFPGSPVNEGKVYEQELSELIVNIR